MGQTRAHFPTLFFAAVFSRYPQALNWAQLELERRAGRVLLQSPVFDFNDTAFYAATMGQDLKKQLLIFEGDFDPGTLADWKILTNSLESQFQSENGHPEPRPLNIDPGYLSEAKLILATTKDRDHRIYLRDGIYAEVTLYYLRTGWQSSRWTYPDYRRPDYLIFFDQARRLLRNGAFD